MSSNHISGDASVRFFYHCNNHSWFRIRTHLCEYAGRKKHLHFWSTRIHHRRISQSLICLISQIRKI